MLVLRTELQGNGSMFSATEFVRHVVDLVLPSPGPAPCSLRSGLFTPLRRGLLAPSLPNLYFESPLCFVCLSFDVIALTSVHRHDVLGIPLATPGRGDKCPRGSLLGGHHYRQLASTP